jgi:methylenetetrahydrofolate reductase (NADPH)
LHVRDLYRNASPVISFEIFPPKSDQAERDLFDKTVPGLKALQPHYLSVTYGAGGGTRETTLRLADRIRREFALEAVHHLTCVNSTRDTLAGILDEIEALGVDNLLALRGDPPKGQDVFTPLAGGFSWAVELIRFVRDRPHFCVGAACYPEGHIECGDRRRDWDFAAAKVDAGADFLITQLFYDWNDFLEMENYLRNHHGVRVPIIPGILPFLRTEQIKRFTKMCGTCIPMPILTKLEHLAADDEAVRQYGVEVATDLCTKALEHGVPGIHFYCLNQLASCREVIHNLKLAPLSSSGATA